MTKAFDQLRERPRTDVRKNLLSYEERMVLREISVAGTRGTQRKARGGRWTPVYYLEGDDQRAAELFAEVNAERIDRLNRSGRNSPQSSLSRPLYDRVLEAAGYKTIRKYRTVVVEGRHESSRTLVIDRDYYEPGGAQRYSSGSPNARVPAGTSLDEIYEAAEGAVTYDVLREHGVEGDLRMAIRYFRDNGLYEREFEEQAYGAEAVVKRETETS
ncbi:hypothetical protein ACFQH6_03565 [Halobacteriaceae archaeon GCM10025711]